MIAYSPPDVWSTYREAQAALLVITGEIGAGKTTWCRELAAQVRSAGFQVAGLLSPGVVEEGRKIAIDLLDLATGEQRRLAKRTAAPDPLSPTPNWQFHAATLAWGDTVLQAIDTCDLLVIDELGPLELRHNRGWQSALPLLQRGKYRAACVVVRPLLVPTFLTIQPATQVIHLEHKHA